MARWHRFNESGRRLLRDLNARTTQPRSDVAHVGYLADIASKTPIRSARDTSSATELTCILSITRLMIYWQRVADEVHEPQIPFVRSASAKHLQFTLWIRVEL